MPYLPATIESLRAQSLSDFEVIVVDDASTDESPRYLKSISDDRFRYFRLERAGVACALNFGIEQADGELIARIDADDIAYRCRLERQAAIFASNTGLVLLGCCFDHINVEGKIIGQGRCLMSDIANRWMLLFTTAFVHPGVMFRKQAAIRAGMYDPECTVAQDYDLWVRLACEGQIGNLANNLIQKRCHANAWGAANRDAAHCIAGRAAAKHAVSSGLSTSGEDFRELFAFLWLGRLPEVSSVADLISAFRRAVEHFRTQAGPAEPEVLGSIAEFETMLRWRCHRFATRTWRNPSTAAYWLRCAKEFDPANGGALKSLRRFFRKLSPSRAPAFSRPYLERPGAVFLCSDN